MASVQNLEDEGMEELIKQAFMQVDIIGPHVRQGHYDLLGPDGEIILPQAWETIIQPNWSINMHMWPMPEPPADVSVKPMPPPPPSPPGTLSPPESPHRATQQGKKERTVTEKMEPRPIANTSPQSEKRLHRKAGDEWKSSPSQFFAWAARGNTAPFLSPSGSSTRSMKRTSRSDSSSVPTHGMPASPGSEAHGDSCPTYVNVERQYNRDRLSNGGTHGFDVVKSSMIG
ncbi:hypothetical protein E8E12_003299 [Didymella heteroderae]|uniref:Ubiquitin-like domain-containing protein n=1 Tax=Didymella heteroderae TaxID=1769908 RepID=A0A9P4WRI6_9PLEO|nr:hypothetical protein E8E12_003299 [Didymella heteroderae]